MPGSRKSAEMDLCLWVPYYYHHTSTAAGMWNPECLLVIGITFLIVHQSSNEVLIVPSKTILFSSLYNQLPRSSCSMSKL
ncbi:hypothetical protein CerSpe_019730 [Prunus speciosa]